MRQLILMLVTGLIAAAIAAGSAFAGEITGNGKETAMRDHANSECAFSGRDDADDDGFEHTQSWGQLVKAFGPMGGVPGEACNGHLSPRK